MTSELARRIAFTLGALLVYRFGAYIPLPGTDAAAWGQATGYHSRDILFGVVDMPAAGTARHAAIFALGIGPYITAAVLIQIVSIAWSRLRNLSAAGERGRSKILLYTLLVALVLAVFQAFAVAQALERVHGLVPQPGLMFELTTTVTLAAGTLTLIWLSNQITLRGFGNGLALVLAVGLVVDFPPVIAAAAQRVHLGILTSDKMVLTIVLAVFITGVMVLFEGARRAIPLNFSERTVGGATIPSRAANLMLKVNGGGLIPAIVVGWVIAIVAVGVMLGFDAGVAIVPALAPGHLPFMILFCILLMPAALIYAAFLIDPDTASETLVRFGGTVKGIAPGEATAGYLDSVLSRLTFLGTIYLAFVFIVPQLLIVYLGVPFYLGGIAFLILVCVTLDMSTQIRQEMQFENLKLNVGGYRR